MKNSIESLYFKSPVLLQNIAISVYGYSLYKKRYTGIAKNIWDELDALNSMSTAQAKAIQDEAVRSMVHYCATSIPYYQAMFSEYGFKPGDITRSEDLRKLPVLDKQTLREKSHLFRPKQRTTPFIVQHTSGSTGTPLAIGLNEYTYKLAMALLVKHEEAHGVQFGAPRATFAGRMLKRPNDTKPPFSRYNKAENQRLFSSYHLSEKTFPHYEDELTKFQPQELIGYPSAISDLAALYQKSGLKPKFFPKVIITNSETLLAWQRQKIELVFGCPVRDYYGTAEYVIFAGQDKDGVYRPNPLLGVTEILQESQYSAEGKVLGTTLTNFEMPLLRYDIGDTASLMNTSDGSIGFPSIRSFNGRQDDYVLAPDGRRIGRLDHIFKGVDGIKEVQIVQKDTTTLLLNVVSDDVDKTNVKTLVENTRARVGAEFDVNVDFLERIPRGKNGKFKSVIGLSSDSRDR